MVSENYSLSINVRVRPEMFVRLKEYATKKRLRASTVARIIIDKHLPEYEQGKKNI